MRTILISTLIAGCLFSSGAWAAEPPATNKVTEPMRFQTPQQALDALRAATQAKDMVKLRAIFGVEIGELGSGDEVQDRADLERFARELALAAEFVPAGDDELALNVGSNGYEFPVPLVRKDGSWFFDSVAGKEELLNRRIGENEMRTIAVCRGYVAAQRDYYAVDWDDDGVIEYAQRLASTPGKKDGLYWETQGAEPASPLGPLVAEARVEGYGKSTPQTTTQPAAGPRPYHGYLYKILSRQGEHAPGGKYDYVINGHMVAGFALVAWPAEWGDSGIITFVVNTNGKVYEKNLGEMTSEIAFGISAYDPDDTWVISKD